MNPSIIIIIILGVIFCVGGPIISHYASKASQNADNAEASKNKTK